MLRPNSLVSQKLRDSVGARDPRARPTFQLQIIG